jgi:hypothetical protein
MMTFLGPSDLDVSARTKLVILYKSLFQQICIVFMDEQNTFNLFTPTHYDGIYWCIILKNKVITLQC